MKQNASVSVWNFFPGIEHFQQHDPCARPGPVQGTWAGAAPSFLTCLGGCWELGATPAKWKGTAHGMARSQVKASKLRGSLHSCRQGPSPAATPFFPAARRPEHRHPLVMSQGSVL